MSETIARFIRAADVSLSHEIMVDAPAALVFDVAEHFQLDAVPLVRATFWLRAKLLGARYRREPIQKGLLAAMQQLGWGVLAYAPGRELVLGAITEPWVGDVKFLSVPPETFASFVEPGLVKIAWTLESYPVAGDKTTFRTETRVQATDDDARIKFHKYWRNFGIGIRMIRWLVLPALKKAAERRYRVEQKR